MASIRAAASQHSDSVLLEGAPKGRSNPRTYCLGKDRESEKNGVLSSELKGWMKPEPLWVA